MSFFCNFSTVMGAGRRVTRGGTDNRRMKEMKHTSKRLLSILLCLVLMLSLIPSAYAADVTVAQAQKLAAEMRNLASEKEAAGVQYLPTLLRSAADDVEATFNNPRADQTSRNQTYEYFRGMFEQLGGDPDDLVIAPDAPDKIDLYPAVQQMNRLYGALGAFATRTMIANSYEGFKNLAELFPKDSAARANALNGHKDVKITVLGKKDSLDSFLQLLWKDVAQQMIDEGWAPSPEGMFEGAGFVLAAWYDYVGEGVITDTNAKIDEQSDKIEADVAAETAKLQESINNALAGAFPNFGQG